MEFRTLGFQGLGLRPRVGVLRVGASAGWFRGSISKTEGEHYWQRVAKGFKGFGL